MTWRFPARLNAFERLMFLLDQPDSPNCLGFRLHFRGQIDRDTAMGAMQQAVQRHPLAQATVDNSGRCFELKNSKDLVFWHDRLRSWPELFKNYDRYRLCWQFENDGDNVARLSLIGPHALGDGVGGLQLVTDWLTAYDEWPSLNANFRPRKLDPAKLAERGTLRMANWRFARKLPFQTVAAFGAAKFILRKPAKLLGHAAASDSYPLEDNFPSIVSEKLDSPAKDRLDKAAEKLNASENDLLIAGLFVALSRWRTRNEFQGDRDWIRLLVPMTTRTIADRRLPGCNKVSLVQVDRRPEQIAGTHTLIAGISRELGVIRRWELDRTMLLALRLASIVPGQIERMASSDKCRATCIVTNMGGAFARLNFQRSDQGYRVGNLHLHDVDMLSPLRKHTPISLAMMEFMGQILISLLADPRELSIEMARELVADYLEVLREFGELAN